MSGRKWYAVPKRAQQRVVNTCYLNEIVKSKSLPGQIGLRESYEIYSVTGGKSVQIVGSLKITS